MLLGLAGKKMSLVAVIALDVIVFFFFVAQTNQTASYSYQISGLETELATLQEQNNNLNLDYIQLQSMDKIVSGAKNLNLVPVDNVMTINAVEGAIAYNSN
jgi:cell division protein FtsL